VRVGVEERAGMTPLVQPREAVGGYLCSSAAYLQNANDCSRKLPGTLELLVVSLKLRRIFTFPDHYQPKHGLKYIYILTVGVANNHLTGRFILIANSSPV
jgi:hypothetical protein